jgi:CRP-like cAMP-binding protein
MDQLKAQGIFREQLKKYIELNEAEWIVFVQYLNFSALKKKRYFAQPGTVCKGIGFIVTGVVRYYNIKDGEEITGYFSFENEYVSSYKSYLTQTPALNYIQALEDTELITITHKDMQLMLTNPMLAYKMERFGRLVAEHYLICYEERISAFITKTPEERYIDLLSTGREILQRMPQHYIAHFLGVTPVSLSRIRRRILANV